MGSPFAVRLAVGLAAAGVLARRAHLARDDAPHATGPNAHRQLSGKLRVAMIVFDLWPRSLVGSTFSTKQHCLDALSALSAIPFLTAEPFFSSFEGKLAIDGGPLLDNPIFTDSVRDQL